MEYSCQPYNEGQFSLTATKPKAGPRPVRALVARHDMNSPRGLTSKQPQAVQRVDFLLRGGGVIKLDGAQHLADAEAYRRDRRKDALQQNGYFVLRFLAEDVGKNHDLILDTVLTALVHREKNRKC